MEFIIFIIFVIINLVLILLIKYYSNLFGDLNRSEYYREELTGITRIIVAEFKKLLDEWMISILSLVAAIFLTWLWTLMGGIIGSPHYTDEFGNYFFLSSFILILTITFLHEIYQFAVNKLAGGNEFSLLAKFFQPKKMIVAGIASALSSANMTIYGMYHEVWFIFVLINLITIYFFTVIYLNDKYPARLIFPFVDKMPDEGIAEDLSDFSEDS